MPAPSHARLQMAQQRIARHGPIACEPLVKSSPALIPRASGPHRVCLRKQPVPEGVRRGLTRHALSGPRPRGLLSGSPHRAPERAAPRSRRWECGCCAVRARYGPIAALGIGSFGPLEVRRDSSAYGRILSTPKPGWSHTDVAGPLGECLGVPVGLGTDVECAALAEGRWGGARGLADFAYVTVGTGVGVGLIVAGRPARGFGHAELGHIRVVRQPGDRWPGACPFHRDCLEGLISGPAIAARTGAAPETPADDHPVWHCVAFALGQLLHTLVLVDFAGKVRARSSREVAFALPETVQTSVRRMAGRLLERARIGVGRVAGLGVAFPDDIQRAALSQPPPAGGPKSPRPPPIRESPAWPAGSTRASLLAASHPAVPPTGEGARAPAPRLAHAGVSCGNGSRRRTACPSCRT